VLHEQSHFLGPEGATQEAARDAFLAFGSRALEEGVAEAWSADLLDDYLVRLDIEKVAPGITAVRNEPSYPAFVPAVRVLTEDSARRSAGSPAEVLQALNRQTAEGQWHVVVDLAYRSSNLPGVVPPEREAAVRLRLETTLRASFGSWRHWSGCHGGWPPPGPEPSVSRRSPGSITSSTRPSATSAANRRQRSPGTPAARRRALRCARHCPECPPRSPRRRQALVDPDRMPSAASCSSTETSAAGKDANSGDDSAPAGADLRVGDDRRRSYCMQQEVCDGL
jgi:hypothetical protein